jgi:hypothetical protein
MGDLYPDHQWRGDREAGKKQSSHSWRSGWTGLKGVLRFILDYYNTPFPESQSMGIWKGLLVLRATGASVIPPAYDILPYDGTKEEELITEGLV